MVVRTTRRLLATLSQAGRAGRAVPPVQRGGLNLRAAPSGTTVVQQKRCLHCSPVRRELPVDKPMGKLPNIHEPKSFKGEPCLASGVLIADPLTRYDHLISTGSLRADDHQRTIIEHLQRMWADLEDYDPGPLPPELVASSGSFVRLLLGSCPSLTIPVQRSLRQKGFCPGPDCSSG